MYNTYDFFSLPPAASHNATADPLEGLGLTFSQNLGSGISTGTAINNDDDLFTNFGLAEPNYDYTFDDGFIWDMSLGMDSSDVFPPNASTGIDPSFATFAQATIDAGLAKSVAHVPPSGDFEGPAPPPAESPNFGCSNATSLHIPSNEPTSFEMQGNVTAHLRHSAAPNVPDDSPQEIPECAAPLPDEEQENETRSRR
jgi:hypothetical protein